MTQADFVHLHVHSEYSLLDGATRIEDMIQRAVELEMPALALTDHGVMFGVVEFYQKARKAGVKPLIGCELYMAPGPRTERTGGEHGAYYHLLALARDQTGYHNLLKLCSHAYMSGFYYKPRVDWELLEQYHEGLVFTSACLAGEVARSVLHDQEDAANRFIGRMSDLVGRENFFLEIMDHGIPEQKKANQGIIALARANDVKLIATNDVHYLRREDYEMHDVLLCVGTGKRVSETNRLRYEQPEFYFKTPEEMAAIFAEIPEALTNTRLVADMCDAHVPLAEGESDNSKFPKYPTSDNLTAERMLRRLTEEGLDRRYGESLSDVHRRQADHELGVIHQTGFDDYFLIVWDFINYARSQDIPVGPGRGSGAGSIVAYCLGITDLDPIAHRLIFERFLNIERLEPPDFDIDFCAVRRPEVVDYVRRKYGRENVCNIVTFGALKAKNAIRDVGRALEVPLDRVNMICGQVPSDPKATIDSALEASEELKTLVQTDNEVRDLMHFARQVEGLHRNSGVHAAGVIITDRPVSDFAPVFCPSGNSDELVCQFAMSDVTDSGLLKMDFLGLKNLTVIADAMKSVELNHGRRIDWDEVSRTDPKTFEFLRTAQTTGVFQLESSGMRDLIRQLGPDSPADIAAIVALFRPGPMDNIPLYLESKRNPERVSYPHPMLEEILSETYGVIVYQEQVMQIAQKMGGFSLGQADILRKAMGKKKEDVMAKMRVGFLEGAEKNGVTRKAADEVWELMAKFAEYGFNKAHTVAYAEVTFRTAYLKAHYPVEFMAALMTNDMSDTAKMSVLFAEAREMGVHVLPPDVNESRRNFTVVDGNIRFGLAAVKNVGGAAVDKVIEEREANGPFTSIQDFCERAFDKGLNARMLECLIKVGAFDSMGHTRSSLLAALPDLLQAAQIVSRERASGQMSLFGDSADEAAGDLASAPIPGLREWSDEEKLAYEKELTGFFITGHPLDALTIDMRSFSTHQIADIPSLEKETPVRLVGQVRDLRQITTRNGEPMAFAQIQDFHGTIEAVVFPRVFEKVAHALAPGALVLVNGKVNERNGSKSIAVDELTDAESARTRLAKFLDVSLPPRSISNDNLGRIKQMLGRRSGRCAVRFLIETDEGPVTVRSDRRYSCAPTNDLIKDLEALPFPKSLMFANA